jgi:hypothetical protein
MFGNVGLTLISNKSVACKKKIEIISSGKRFFRFAAIAARVAGSA